MSIRKTIMLAVDMSEMQGKNNDAVVRLYPLLEAELNYAAKQPAVSERTAASSKTYTICSRTY